MINNDKPFARRDFLRGSLAAGGPHPGQRLSSPRARPRAPASNPERGSVVVRPGRDRLGDQPVRRAGERAVDAVIFNGGYGIDYVEFAAEQMQELQAGVTVKVGAVDQDRPGAAAAVRGRQPAGPDRQLRCGQHRHGHDPRPARGPDTVIDAPNLEGTTIRDTLFGGVLEPGTFDGKLASSTTP